MTISRRTLLTAIAAAPLVAALPAPDPLDLVGFRETWQRTPLCWVNYLATMDGKVLHARLHARAPFVSDLNLLVTDHWVSPATFKRLFGA